MAIDFRTVSRIGRALDEVEETTYYGLPALRRRGHMIACMAGHPSAEPNTLAIPVPFEQRDEMLAAEPETYYLKDHYVNYPVVLVRLTRVHRDALRDLLTASWRAAGTRPARKPGKKKR